MSIPSSLTPLFSTGSSAAAGYQVSRSLRFNSSDGAYLSKSCATPSTSWTWSAWVKRSKLSDYQYLFVPRMSGYNVGLNFNNDDRLRWYDTDGTNNYNYYSTAVFRDVSAWYHIVMRVSAGAFTIYVNNTSHITGTLYQALASGTWYQGSTYYSGSPIYGFDGYLADIHFIDGQALTPSSFTEVSATTGQLIPLAYTGTFGTNGFWLKFSDNSAATAAALGNDYSGNNNDWTPNNLSVTAGAGNDSLVDTPTSYGTDTSVGGEVRGNYCTWNPLLASGGSGTLTNGNLDSSYSSGGWYSRVGTIYASSGKYYWEHTITAGSTNKYVFTGIATPAYNGADFPGSGAGNSYAWYGNEGNLRPTAQAGWNVTYDNGDVIGVALDMDNGKLYFSKNGTFVNSSNPAAQTNPQVTGLAGYAWAPAISYFTGYGGTVNFGQRAFAYTAPSGFKALCDTNLPAPLTAKPNTLMDVLTWSGSGGNRSFSSLGFSPDFVWIKQRNQAYTVGHQIYDIVRGAGSLKQLDSSNTTAEGGGNTNQYGYLSSFDSNGFGLTVGSVDSDYVNKSGVTYVAWAWDAGTTTASNTSGSITSQVRANASAGFSVVTYTGSGTTATVGHGLGVAPSLIICKSRNSAVDWAVYHVSTGRNGFLLLNSTAAFAGYSGYWGNSNPSSTVISFDSVGYSGNNASGLNYVAYCFAPVVGYSSAFTYNANGSNDGPMVYLGFRPRFILLKSTNISGTEWMMWDAARGDYNVVNPYLLANRSNAEGSTGAIDFLSNGFKLRNISDSWNNSGATGTYVGFAWAESPFQYARAR